MIALNQLSMAFGQKLLFMNVSLTLEPGSSYALVGANGAGKTTLFKLLLGEEESTEGDVKIPKDATVGWLKQDQFKYENTVIRDIVLQGKPILWAALQERDALFASETWTDEQGFRLGALEDVIAHQNGYTAISDAEQILTGLGITATYFDKPLNALSGGYKLRVLLAQTLFENPSILLLDEPTNHLDILSIAWLEKFLKEQYKGLIVFISHDVAFINNVADYIVDIDYGEIRQYKGKYQRFLSEKALIQAQKLVELNSAEAKIADMQRFVDRFKAKASKAAQARSRMKMIEKVELPDIKQSSRRAPKLQFNQKRPSGKIVLKAKGVCKSYQDKTLYKALNVEINRGERVAILGVNGVGKSTLIKIMLGLVQPDAGECEFGHEVHLSYFSQDHHELLTGSMSVLSWLCSHVPAVTEQQARGILAQMLFVKDEVDKNISTLSGGEAARVLLAKVMLESPNLLVLDEPTNHMDLETTESLAKALSVYPGTVIFVSHNRYLIDEVATRVVYLDANHKVKDFKGGYQAFLKINEMS